MTRSTGSSASRGSTASARREIFAIVADVFATISVTKAVFIAVAGNIVGLSSAIACAETRGKGSLSAFFTATGGAFAPVAIGVAKGRARIVPLTFTTKSIDSAYAGFTGASGAAYHQWSANTSGNTSCRGLS